MRGRLKFSGKRRFTSKRRGRIALWLCVAWLAACSTPTAPIRPSAVPGPSPTQATILLASPTPSVTPKPTPGGPIWENFPAPQPQTTAITPIPPPLSGLVIPEEVRVLVIAGVDQPYPYTGRTDALALVVYHPRLARASLISIPPDLMGYIPGFTMQRLYTAYALGGPRMLDSAMEYNLGLKPDQYLVFNLDSFSQLIDDLGGIHLTVLENVQKYCPGLMPGVVLMQGEEALCYMRLRLGDDEAARNRRQQQVFGAVFLRMVEGGNLVRVPELYHLYRSSVDSNLTLEELVNAVPLALKLGDPQRIGYFAMTDKERTVWQIEQQPPTNVLLPVRPALMVFLQRAIDFVSTPSPLSEVVVTLEYQLTVSPTPTSTSTITPTPTATVTPTRTASPRPSITPTPTASHTPDLTITHAATATPTPSVTFTPSVTP